MSHVHTVCDHRRQAACPAGSNSGLQDPPLLPASCTGCAGTIALLLHMMAKWILKVFSSLQVASLSSLVDAHIMAIQTSLLRLYPAPLPYFLVGFPVVTFLLEPM